jgi:nitrate reductase gamma subunit
MSNEMFSEVPVAALIVCAMACAVVCRRSATGSDRRMPGAWTAARASLLVAFAAVAIEHLLLLAAPQAVLRWNGDARRLIVLEAGGAIAGCGCVAAALIALWQQLFTDRSRDQSIGRTLNLSVASVTMVSGVAIALVYRWASSWSVVTLTPYVLSLPSPHPRVDLVASTPFLVRLHVLGAFASIALVPFGDTFAGFVARVRRAARTMAMLASRARVPHAPLNMAAVGSVAAKAVWSEEERRRG